MAYFEVQTNILISYTVTRAGYNAKKGTLTVETGTAYEVEYVTLTTPYRRKILTYGTVSTPVIMALLK